MTIISTADVEAAPAADKPGIFSGTNCGIFMTWTAGPQRLDPRAFPVFGLLAAARLKKGNNHGGLPNVHRNPSCRREASKDRCAVRGAGTTGDGLASEAALERRSRARRLAEIGGQYPADRDEKFLECLEPCRAICFSGAVPS